MSDGVVRGWVHAYAGKVPLTPPITLWDTDASQAPMIRAMLVPDDGTQVVVGMEEWEAVRALIREGLDDCYRANDPDGLVARTAAILGTNGGGE